MAVYLLAQNWEILAKGIPIYRAGGKPMHVLICYTRWRATLFASRHQLDRSVEFAPE
jgi:hypothetical protein